MRGPTPGVACPHTPVGTPARFALGLASSLQADARCRGTLASGDRRECASNVLEQGKRTNRGTWVEPTIEACSTAVNQPSRKPMRRLMEFGGRTRARTWDPLIKSPRFAFEFANFFSQLLPDGGVLHQWVASEFPTVGIGGTNGCEGAA